jgi:hypothetical protein
MQAIQNTLPHRKEQIGLTKWPMGILPTKNVE